MIGLHRKFSENLVLFVLASFAFVNVLGMGMGMEIMGGQMSSCPLMAGQAAMCQMDITEHIAKWQHAFLGIPTKANVLAFALVLFAVVIIPPIRSFFQFEKLFAFTARLFVYHKAYLVKVFDPLLQAFSDGILNPKIYEFATF